MTNEPTTQKRVKPTRRMPSQDYLNECFVYCKETGVLRWKARPEHHFAGKKQPARWNQRRWLSNFAGKVAGFAESDRYIQVKLDRITYYNHRIIWKLVHGEEPEEIDHKNGNKADNRIENLRCVTRSQNQKNQKLRSDNTSGVSGVSRDSTGRKWQAQIADNGKSIYLGTFAAKDDAIAARKAAEKRLEYHSNHGRR